MIDEEQPDERRANPTRRRNDVLAAALVSHAPDLTVVVEADGSLRAASGAAERILGWQEDDLLGENVFALLHPDDQEGALVSFGNTSQVAGVHERLELRLRRQDGSYAPVEVMANNRLEDPEIAGVVITVRDLSDRYRAEDALLTSTLRMRALLASLPVGILVEDGAGRIVLANEQLVEMLRVPAGTVNDLVGGDAATLHRHIDALAAVAGSHADATTSTPVPGGSLTGAELVLSDGRTLEVDLRTTDIDGAVLERLWSFRDVTDRRQAEALVAATRDRALQALDAKSQFLAMLSHEVRTPINGLIGMLDVLRDRSHDLDEETMEILSGIRSAADSLMDVLDDSLDVARIEAGQLELQEVEFDLREVVESAAETLGPLARDRQVALLTRIDPSLPSLVTGDPGRLRQVLLNLVGNALRHTERGEVVVRVLPDSSPRAEQLVRVRVSDSGAGIEASALDTLFEPFAQGAGAREGAGLGLAISRRLVELMGGTIGARSVLGEGSTFSFTVRLVAASPPPPGLGAGVGTARVLVARTRSHDVLEELLRGWGIEVLADEDPRPADLIVATTDESHRVPMLAGPAARVILLGCSHEPPGIPGATHLALPARAARLFGAILGAPARRSPPPAAQQRLRGRVLLAEDDTVSRRIATIALEHLGLEVVAVPHGAAAVEAAREQPFDVVLMDCQMPVMDGFAASRELRSIEGGLGVRTPIVALTAGVLPSDQAACRAAGMDDFLAKPVTGDRLREVLEPWLGGTPEAADAPSPALDAAVLDGLAEELDDDAILAEVLGAYLQELPGRREGITAAAAAGDVDTVRSVAHTLKSSSSALGALGLSQACADAEAAARAGDLHAVARLVGPLVVHIDAAEAAIGARYRALLGADDPDRP